MTLIEEPRSDVASAEHAYGRNSDEVRSKVPFAITDPLWIPKERYFDREFFELEKKYVWERSWLMAARLEEIPNPGDYAEFEVVGNSILIVRQQDGSVKALHNACRHRATELAKGHGRLPGGQLVCPFHGWRWNLDGSNSFVFMDGSFDPSTLQEDDLQLREAKVEIWAGQVWINMDHNARPLDEALSPIKDLMDSCGIGYMQSKWWKQVTLNANWKMVMEAFYEGYHVMQTHPQLQMGRGQEFAENSLNGTEYLSYENGHSSFGSRAASSDDGDAARADGDAIRPARTTDWDLEDFIESNRLLANGQDAMAVDRDIQIFEGVRNKVDPKDPSAIATAIMALYEYAAGAGIPMAPLTDREFIGGVITVFPHYFFLPMYGNCLVYRMRPHEDDPEKTLFDVWSLITYPEGQEPERVELQGRFDKDDADHWGLIPRQDFGNIERQQRGLHSQSFAASRLSAVYEQGISNLHEQIDRVIAEGIG